MYSTDSEHYKTLGVNESANLEEIKKAYKRMAMKYHPDRSINKDEKTQKSNEELFKKVNTAYQILSDKLEHPEKHRQNDFSKGDNNAYNTEDINDFMHHFHVYEDLQDFFNKKTKGNKSNSPKKHINKIISLEKYFQGHKINIGTSYQKSEEFTISIPSEKFSYTFTHDGIEYDYNFLIESKKYEIDDINVKMELNVPYYIALLGGKVSFKYANNKEYAINIKEFTQNKSTLRLKGKGLNSMYGYGDLLLTINITIPTKLGVRQKQALLEAYKNDINIEHSSE